MKLLRKSLKIFLFFFIVYVLLCIFALSSIDDKQFEFDNLIIKFDDNGSKIIEKE
ncbi:hypothetical protein [Campylobacter lanienae]|uniref:hypothetical protein n=1 Tax=Campylobacter lanienae TaxID=75658 RepID=UPI0015D6D6A9|nr:hypothetical protein [Campylobacter lanienae]